MYGFMVDMYSQFRHSCGLFIWQVDLFAII